MEFGRNSDHEGVESGKRGDMSAAKLLMADTRTAVVLIGQSGRSVEIIIARLHYNCALASKLPPPSRVLGKGWSSRGGGEGCLAGEL